MQMGRFKAAIVASFAAINQSRGGIPVQTPAAVGGWLHLGSGITIIALHFPETFPGMRGSPKFLLQLDRNLKGISREPT
jgi:hypothetical protein